MVTVGSTTIEDPGHVTYNQFATVVSNFSSLTGRMSGVSRLVHLAAQRFFLGGDKFPQSYSKALDLIKSGDETPEGLVITSAAKYLGLGTTKDRTAAFRMAAYGAFQTKTSLAAANLAVMLLEYARTPDGIRMKKEIEEEAIRILELTLEMNVPSAGFNLMAHHLNEGLPVKPGWLVGLSGSMTRGMTSATHTIGGLTSSTLLGLRSCSQSWSLLARLIRRGLWYQTVHATLDANGPSSDIADIDLIDLTTAGVDDADLALALRDNIMNKNQYAKSRLLAFSAYRGRAAAQFAISKQFQASPIRNIIGNDDRELKSSPNDDDNRSHIDLVLDSWDVHPWKQINMDPEYLSRSAVESIVNDPDKWVLVEDQATETKEFMAESLFVLAWTSFLGKGTEQSLRDSIIWFGKLSKSMRGYWIVEKLHYLTLQLIFTTNMILNTWTMEVVIALISLLFVGGILMVESNV